MQQNINQLFKLSHATQDNIFDVVKEMNPLLIETYQYQVLPLTFWDCFQFSVNHHQDPYFNGSFKDFILDSQMKIMHEVASPNFRIQPLASGGVAVSISNHEYFDALAGAGMIELFSETDYESLEQQTELEDFPLSFGWDFSVTERIIDGIFNGFHKVEKHGLNHIQFDSDWFVSRFLHQASVAEKAIQNVLFQQVCNQGLFPMVNMPYVTDQSIQASILLNTQDRTDDFMEAKAKCSQLSIGQLSQHIFNLDWKELSERFRSIINTEKVVTVYLETLHQTMEIHIDD